MLVDGPRMLVGGAWDVCCGMESVARRCNRGIRLARVLMSCAAGLLHSLLTKRTLDQSFAGRRATRPNSAQILTLMAT